MYVKTHLCVLRKVHNHYSMLFSDSIKDYNIERRFVGSKFQ